jgi:hypothetical protein
LAEATCGKYTTAKQVQDAWSSAWTQLTWFGNTRVYVSGTDIGPVTDAMFLDLAARTGLSFSYSKLASKYQRLVNRYLASLKVRLQQPNNLPSAFK